MSLYTRPDVLSYIKYPPPSGTKYVWYRRASRRHVSKPVGKEPCPYELQDAYSWVLARGPDAAPSGNEDALNGVGPACAWSNCGDATSISLFGGHIGFFASAKAYDRFVQRVKGSSLSLAVNLGERREAIEMIVARAQQLRRAWVSLKRGEFLAFLRHLAVKPLPHHRRWRRAHHASSTWLEYHFGWSPLLGDIYNACDLLQSKYPDSRLIKARGRASGRGSRPLVGDTEIYSLEANVGVEIGAEVSISNPNLFLANRLGVINPASVAWELIPFSFLVDWFIPVGKFLDSYTDFVGLSLKSSYTTWYVRSSAVVGYYWKPSGGRYGITQQTDAVHWTRALGVVSPSLIPKQWKGLSVSRAATSMSLLIQVFKPGR